MGDLWATMLPAAIVIALSPTGLSELILVLFSARARVNALMFLASVIVSVFVLPLLGASILSSVVTSDTRAAASAVTAWALVVLGILMVIFAVSTFLKGTDPRRPAMFDKVTGMGAGAVFVLSLSVVWLNPINALVLLSVGSRAAALQVPTTTLVPSLAVFTVFAAAPFIAVVALLMVGGERASATLGELRQRLVHHNRMVMAILGLVGVVLVAQGTVSLMG